MAYRSIQAVLKKRCRCDRLPCAGQLGQVLFKLSVLRHALSPLLCGGAYWEMVDLSIARLAPLEGGWYIESIFDRDHGKQFLISYSRS